MVMENSAVLYSNRKRDCHQHERTSCGKSPNCLDDNANGTELDHNAKDLVNTCESIILL